MSIRATLRPPASLALAALLALSARADDTVAAASTSTTLTLAPEFIGSDPGQIPLGYYPVRLPLSAEKPAGITREPLYAATPLYTALHLGNGPNNTFYIAVDRPAEGTWRIYLDQNRNGDLTDDGDSTWKSRRQDPKRVFYGTNHYLLKASWGTAEAESTYSDFGVNLYCFTGSDYLLAYRTAARTGSLTLDGRSHRVAVVENDTDALYNKAVATDAQSKPTEPMRSRPVWLLVDWADDGSFKATTDKDYYHLPDIRAPFQLGNTVYEATLSADGVLLTLTPTDKPAAAPLPPFQ